ncbi:MULTISPECIES: GMC family oxidoreductase [unclassified Colwellia]|uniref:GMC family oxidoreductase n=1 Tax=unclassified Colwellia TaxID=196834 RepID=UPI0015F67D47|nr:MULTISPECIES: GMC family oxidoreductase [unclassified Colwellia]MBA6231078.1 GMC family oxidoreductase [Colwellia sp. MB02u-7]MBA6235154.1 GMC family oxidoreductase [Colwellia sp. MB02u-11]MBA6257459.1 GMC family oxidoreductase [Colwellia sp. MB3u-28]MBA6260531.1 GMC family oxidoreductase [Colwellia sp. MB3u-41]MBA6301637.1 GMC family oxidoreductase [Colwellia sp. MB3u-22]
MSFDICIVGSGAGASPVAYTLAKAGAKVLILEKGPWLTEKEFFKDELAISLRDSYNPKLIDEQHVIEEEYETDSGESYWQGEPTSESGWSFWNGNVVGGSSNFMSGYFHRLKPVDFKLKSTFGEIEGANIVDWPISYDDLEPFYAQVEREVGVSGRTVAHPHQEPRSTVFPYPPLVDHQVSGWIDKAAKNIGYHSMPVPRAILSTPAMGRKSCEYSGYCSSYGCSTGAKGSGRAALLNHAVTTGNLTIKANAKVYHIASDDKGEISAIHYYDSQGREKKATAKIYVVACQAVETSRLLLASTGKKFPQGLANNSGQVGKNLVFSGGGTGKGDFLFADLTTEKQAQLKQVGPFINRALQDWYQIDDKSFSGANSQGKAKGGTIDFLFYQNPIARAQGQQFNDESELVWGEQLQKNLKEEFTTYKTLRFEVFNDWLPTDDCFVSLDTEVTDKWGQAVAKVRIGAHQHDMVVGEYLADKGEKLLASMGAKNVTSSVSSYPPTNLMAGGCRFGHDPKTSVLNKYCQAHEVDNLYVTDGSFMPTGGSVPYTFTIYANAFRVAEHIKERWQASVT